MAAAEAVHGCVVALGVGLSRVLTDVAGLEWRLQRERD